VSYRRKLLRHLKESPLPAGRVSHCEVRHDDWCALLKGSGLCNCNPDIETGVRIDRKYSAQETDG